MPEDTKEDLKNGGQSDDRNGEGTGSTGNAKSGTSGSSEGSEGSSTGSSTGSAGSNGGGEGTQGSRDGSEGSSAGSAVDDRKSDILARIRSKRGQGKHEPSAPKGGTDSNDHEGNVRNSEKPVDGTSGDNRTVSGNGRNNRRRKPQSSDRDPQSSQNSQAAAGSDRQVSSNDSSPSSSHRSAADKPSGLEVVGAGKFKKDFPAPPKMRFTWDDKTLTKKEADELLPKFKGMLGVLFRAFDSGITVTNREGAKAEIWQTIDDEDVTIIAQHFVDMAQASKIIATVVRRMSNSYRLFEINLITLPKLIQTFQFYQAHGGFMLIPRR